MAGFLRWFVDSINEDCLSTIVSIDVREVEEKLFSAGGFHLDNPCTSQSGDVKPENVMLDEHLGCPAWFGQGSVARQHLNTSNNDKRG